MFIHLSIVATPAEPACASPSHVPSAPSARKTLPDSTDIIENLWQNATISKQGPKSSDSKNWSADNGALSIDLHHDWRVTFAVAKDDATALVAHVFYSTQKAQRQYGDYSFVIGARKDIDPPEYKI